MLGHEEYLILKSMSSIGLSWLMQLKTGHKQQLLQKVNTLLFVLIKITGVIEAKVTASVDISL